MSMTDDSSRPMHLEATKKVPVHERPSNTRPRRLLGHRSHPHPDYTLVTRFDEFKESSRISGAVCGRGKGGTREICQSGSWHGKVP